MNKKITIIIFSILLLFNNKYLYLMNNKDVINKEIINSFKNMETKISEILNLLELHLESKDNLYKNEKIINSKIDTLKEKINNIKNNNNNNFIDEFINKINIQLYQIETLIKLIKQ